jgi:hypothetical protein
MIRAEEIEPGVIKLWNHIFYEPKRFSKATLDKSLRIQIKETDLMLLEQSHYQVTERQDGYHGEIEPGSVCIVNRQGKDTILVSSFHLQGDQLSTLDRGQDPLTNEQCWGSIAGEFRFRRLQSWKATWNQSAQSELKE